MLTSKELPKRRHVLYVGLVSQFRARCISMQHNRKPTASPYTSPFAIMTFGVVEQFNRVKIESDG